MALGAIGLKTHIWNNNFWSLALMGLYPFIMLGLLWLIGAAIGWGLAPYGVDREVFAAAHGNGVFLQCWPLLLTAVAIWFLVSYFFHNKMIAKLAHAREVTRSEEPELYNLLENLSITAGIPTPKLNIVESHARNAFASGINQKSFTVTVTRGLINSLTKDEVEAVLAHELTHILNRDVRLLMICIIFTGMIGFAAQLVWSNLRFALFMPRRGGRRDGRMVIVFFIIAAILWIGYMATLFTRFAVSRKREYMADAGAIELTKKPEAMMTALMRIAGMDKMKSTSGDIQMMCIENTVPFLGLFSTHPPIERRVYAISKTTHTPLPDLDMRRPETASNPLEPNRAPEKSLTRQRPFRKNKNPWVD